MAEHAYIAIDLKSFYASVECVQRNLDPLNTHLVVADASRTEKTICLAVSPSLKELGIAGRPRLFEVVEKIKQLNRSRAQKAGGELEEESYDRRELAESSRKKIAYIVATPQMEKYMECSTHIFQIYLRYVAPEDIHIYSVDECFIDVTNYLKTYDKTPRELAVMMIRAVLAETGITATCGIGTNLYLAKVAMDIVAKRATPDADGVRIAQLNEMTYRETLWTHQPLTDFWRIGRGTSRKLQAHQMYTMGDVARCSCGGANELHNEELLYKLFGVGAELLIDHAWGWEPCTIRDIKDYKPDTNGISRGQVLKCAYSAKKGRLIVREMAEIIALELAEKKAVCDRISLVVCYDTENAEEETADVVSDFYGRSTIKPAHGSIQLAEFTASSTDLIAEFSKLYDEKVNPHYTVRRFYLSADHVIPETEAAVLARPEQLDFFTDPAEEERKKEQRKKEQEKQKAMQGAMLKIKERFGKNAILRGMDLEEGATAMERNAQVGGHKA